MKHYLHAILLNQCQRFQPDIDLAVYSQILLLLFQSLRYPLWFADSVVIVLGCHFWRVHDKSKQDQIVPFSCENVLV